MSHLDPTEIPPARAQRGQFVLGPATDRPRDGFTHREQGGWRLGTCELPVVGLRSRDGDALGWCLGHPVLDGVLLGDDITVGTSETARVDWSVVDALYERLAGRFLLVLLAADEPTVILDAYGSLAAVWSADERVVASTTTLIEAEWDTELLEASGLPRARHVAALRADAATGCPATPGQPRAGPAAGGAAAGTGCPCRCPSTPPRRRSRCSCTTTSAARSVPWPRSTR